MGFCKFSAEVSHNTSTLIDNNFIQNYMPSAPETCVKVYLLGLCSCKDDSSENTLEYFAKKLNITPEDVESCFLYWQEQGLVTIIQTKPIEVRYLPVKSRKIDVKKFSKSKYSSFNTQIQEILEGRMITPTEFAEYYTLIESFHIEPTALVMIAKYCTMLKGNSVGYPYILTIAKNWAYEGVKTATDVENKLLEHELITNDVGELLKLLGSKKQPDFQDKQLFQKWTKTMYFSKDVVCLVAKNFKKKCSMEKLDSKLEKYYSLKLLSEKEIEDYEENKTNLIKSAKEITKQIGVYYENLENVIETYIVKWQNMGYDSSTLSNIANFCFKNNIKTLDGMNDTVEKFYSLGLTTKQSIDEYFSKVLSADKDIKEILGLVGLNRSVTSWDRDFYRTWTFGWNFSLEIIKYACSFAVGKSHPLSYVNKILSEWHKNNIDTLEKAKQQKIGNFDYPNKSTVNIEQRSYSAEEINALFDNLKEVKFND